MISDESKERLLKMRSILKEIKISSVLLLLGASALLAFSFISAIGFSIFYGIFEQFDPLSPQIAEKPLLAAVVGAVFVGVSVGSCVRVGGVFKLYSTEQNLVFVADCYFIRTNHRANAEGKTSGILSGACGRIL